MDYMDSGLRYTPQTDKDWDTSVQFLPASDNKKLEKKKGRKIGAVIAVVIFAAVVALMTGLLVWHFHFRKDVRVKRMFTGSLRITNQVFEDAYENSNSPEFKALAKQVVSQLKQIYSKSPSLAKYYVGSTVQAFSEGSVIAYYLSEFSVPASQVAAMDNAMASMDKLVEKEQRTISRKSNSLILDDVTSSALDTRMFSSSFERFMNYAEHAQKNIIGNIKSPGFPNSPYPPNTFIQWQLRADPGYVVKLDFDTLNLEENCKNDFVKIYDSLVAIESQLLQELCGYYSPSERLVFVSSRNVMLVTMATNDKGNYPGFQAQVTQMKRSEITCGGQLSNDKGRFTSPGYPNFYPPRTLCQWSIQVAQGKSVKVTFNKLYLDEDGGKSGETCDKDYVEINEKQFCGTHPDKTVTVTSDNNQMTVLFYSDASLVNEGFEAEYETIDLKNPCPKQFQCSNKRCIPLALKCDGWNDCGDLSDEINCNCDAKQLITCLKPKLCKPRFFECDSVNDCPDGTDEKNCGCDGQRKCKNGKCYSEKLHCDGKDDCGDGSDELECTRGPSIIPCTELTYKCKNGKCIDKVNPECDGTRQCDDGSDEEGCDCGRSMFKTSRIVGGVDAIEGEFPWQVSLHIKGFGHVCGASIIHPRWLVTAAHCVQDDGKSKYSQPGTWEAYLGLHTQRKTGNMVVKKNLKQIISHPYYNHYTYDNDIALMELDSPVTYSDYIRPICLPSPQHEFPSGQTVWITGWGATREGGFAATVLQKAQVRIINHGTCNKLMNNQLTSRMLCAGILSGGVDACQGDSGGPLSSPSGARMFLAGVVSWGDGCARRNKPGIYTTVTKYRGWIQQHAGV